MQRTISRKHRVAEQIKRELAMIIQRQMKDNKLGMVTVSGVDLTKDLAYAKVYVTELSSQRECVDILNKATGFLRHELGKQMKLRIIPELVFHYDRSIDEGEKMDALFDKIARTNNNKE